MESGTACESGKTFYALAHTLALGEAMTTAAEATRVVRTGH